MLWSLQLSQTEMMHMNDLVNFMYYRYFKSIQLGVDYIKGTVSLFLDNKWYDLYFVVTIIGIDFVHSSKIFPKG